jgi:hypothetical protein
MEITDPGTSAPPRRPLSISQVRTYLTCGNAYRLRFIERHLPRPRSGLWYGSVMHRCVRRAYCGETIAEAHAASWGEACASAMPLLVEWLALHEEYAACGRPSSKAAQAWLAAHPRYPRVLEEIDAYQQSALGHVRWGERSGLAHYYRRSAGLLQVVRGELLLDGPLLVDGRPPDAALWEAGGAPDPGEGLDEEDSEKGGDYTPLLGDLGGLPIVGVPDVVAFDGHTYSLADYKFWSTPPLPPDRLAVDGQLMLYYHLLVQNGVVDAAAPVRLGHIYPRDDGSVVQVWTDAARSREVLALLAEQFKQVDRQIEAEVFIPVSGLTVPIMSPCGQCDMRHVCPAVLGG